MNPLNKTLLAALLTCLVALPALAGPSDGTGTNILIKENELVDFVKFQQDGGRENYLISSRKFKQKGDTSVYEKVKPLIDRAEEMYPGMGQSMEKAFDKPWLVVDAEFAGRKEGERKVISQTKDAVYVSLKWLRSASPEQLKQAFFHEGVRNFAQAYIPFMFESKSVIAPQIEDEITESLTPALYTKQPSQLVEARFDKIRSSLKEHGNRTGRVVVNKLINRADLYADIKATDAVNSIRKICAKADGGFWENSNINKEQNSWADKMNASKAPITKLEKYRYAYVGSAVTATSMDEGAESTITFLRDLMNSGRTNSATADQCKSKKYEAFLKEYERNQGRTANEELDELPDAVEKAAE